MGNSLSVKNPMVKDYAFYTSILTMKMLSMTLLTGYRRITARKGINPDEDKFSYGKEIALHLNTNESIERVRRAHMNDLENIPLFIFISGLYLYTEPEPSNMNMLLKTYTATRMGHTLVNAFREVPQPARAIFFGVDMAITFYMSYQVFLYFKN